MLLSESASGDTHSKKTLSAYAERMQRIRVSQPSTRARSRTQEVRVQRPPVLPITARASGGSVHT